MPNLMSNQRQFSHSNWKLYAENTRDPYHASLLHLFHNTFGLYRSTQTGECLMDESKRHSFLYSKAGSNDAARDSEVYQDSRSFDTSFSLQDPSRSEEHTSELQSLMRISYAVFCLTKKIKTNPTIQHLNNHTY